MKDLRPIRRCVDCNHYPVRCGYWTAQAVMSGNNIKPDCQHNCQDFQSKPEVRSFKEEEPKGTMVDRMQQAATDLLKSMMKELQYGQPSTCR